MSQSVKPKSSTSEATMTKPKIQKIRRCSDSEEEEGDKVPISAPSKAKTSASESAKPRANITRQRVKSTPAESDDEGDEEDSESDESEDEQTNIKKPVKATSSANSKKPVETVRPVKTVKKQASSKKIPKKRAADSDDDEVFQLTTKSKKPRAGAASSSSRKRQPVQQVIESEDDSEDDSEDEVAEPTKKPTKSKPKTTQKQPIKPSKVTPTKRKQIFQTSTDLASEDEDEESDSSEEEDLPKITLTERIGDLFAAPPNTLLVHACNCVGSWNAGIALAFQKNYPQAYTIYQNHCANRTPNSLLSTCLLIPPQPGAQYHHWIGCLFTSRKYGRGKDSKEDILDSTDSALQDMLEQYEELKKKPKGIWMCKINSGSFKVPWMQTKKLIEALTFKGGLHIEIVDKK